MLKKIVACLIVLLMANMGYGAPKKESLPPRDNENPYILMELFGTVFEAVKSDYVEEAENKKLIESAIDGMLTSLDPHSGFMNAESYDEMETQTKGEFGGLGIEVTSDEGFVRVMSPIDDTPAFRAGLQTGDYITHIDGISVVGMNLNEAVKKMRGKVGTQVTLTISRKDKEPFDVVITRAVIKIEPVKYEVKNDVGYIRIVTFSETTEKMVKKAVVELKKKIGKDKIVGYVLDLRNNPGGLLDQAIGVADLFLNSGEIVSTRSRRAEDTMSFSATDGDITDGMPLVVLINEGSASASEIVAGALQDHHRALVVGLKSFGKGSVQTIKEIPGFGGVRMTTARYYTPSGISIQAKGITPDIIIPRAKLEELPVITGFGEQNLPKAISAEVGKKAGETDKVENKNKKSDKKDNEDDADYQLDRAMDILRALYLAGKNTQQEAE